MLSAQQLIITLNAALQKLWVNDATLFVDGKDKTRTIHERTVVARLLHHLVCVSLHYSTFITNNLSWDFEYNRQVSHNTSEDKLAKTTESKNVKSYSVEGDSQIIKRIFPDLILHERNTNNNCCVIEVKCSPSGALKKKNLLKDYHTLIGMLKTHNYQYAISLIISNKDANLTWFTTEEIKSPLVYIDKEQKQSIDTTIKHYGEYAIYHVKHCGEYAIYHGANLPQCAKNALNSLT